MKITPKTEKEISNLLPDGVYDAEIGTAEEAISRAGSEMIVLDVTVFDKGGGKRFIKDYLLEAIAYKLRHASESCGILDKYEAGVLTADDFIGKGCKVKIKTDEKDPNYPPKNIISDYLVEGGSKSQRAKQSDIKKDEDEVMHDSIPF